MDQSVSRGHISMLSAAFMGIGSMVGAGIFALLGEAGTIAGSAVWLSFLIAGGIAMLQGYSFAKLGAAFPSKGGLMEFLLQGFGNGHLTGTVSWLYYLVVQFVIVMVSLSFGSYAGTLFFGEGVKPEAEKLLAIVIILVMTWLNLEHDRSAVARVQSTIVWAVIAILGGFAFITVRNADFSLLSPDGYPAPTSVISSVAITFFAFLGFAVVAFSAPDLRNPERDLPRAMFLAIGTTTVLYVSIAIGVFGMLTLEEVIAAGNTAIAEAAEPVLGPAGFTIMTIAAVFSTSSAVNSQFFATTGVVGYLAEIGQFPAVLGSRTGKNGNLGTAMSAILVVVLVLLFDLSAIASMGSAVAFLIMLMVSVAHLRRIDETRGNPFVIYFSIAAVIATLLVFIFVTLADEPQTAMALVAFLLLAVVVDRYWRRIGFLQATPPSD